LAEAPSPRSEYTPVSQYWTVH